MKIFLTALAIIAAATQFSAANNITCGKQAPGNEPIDETNQQQYINGGIHAKPHSWPWAAVLLGDDGKEPLARCGATIVDKRWVLTSGRCVTEETKPSHIKVGADDRGPSIDPNEPTQQVFSVEKSVIHPDFDPETLAFDVSLLKLDRDIEFNENVRPICLPDALETLAVGELATTIGWGFEDLNTPELRELQQLQLPVMDTETCNSTVWDEMPDMLSVLGSCMICAGYTDTHNITGIFPGDRGGSLMAFHDGVWKLYGVTSWRIIGILPEFYLPSVFAYVPKMVDWIKQTIESD